MQLPSEGATKLVDVAVAKNAPEAVARGEVGGERAGILEEKTDISKLGLEPREEGREGGLVTGEVLVALALVVVQIAHLAELVLALLLLLVMTVIIGTISLRRVGSRFRFWLPRFRLFFHYRADASLSHGSGRLAGYLPIGFFWEKEDPALFICTPSSVKVPVSLQLQFCFVLFCYL